MMTLRCRQLHIDKCSQRQRSHGLLASGAGGAESTAEGRSCFRGFTRSAFVLKRQASKIRMAKPFSVSRHVCGRSEGKSYYANCAGPLGIRGLHQDGDVTASDA